MVIRAMTEQCVHRKAHSACGLLEGYSCRRIFSLAHAGPVELQLRRENSLGNEEPRAMSCANSPA